MEIDLDKAIDNFCSICGKKKKKYIGSIAGTPAVMYQSICKCNDIINIDKIPLTDNKMFERLQTPFWKMAGLKPKPKEIALDRYLKWKGKTYGDWRRERDKAAGANNPSGMKQFEEHWHKYGRDNEPVTPFTKSR
jgi:hypothetical protein